ncbi:hypothetical protein AB0L40_05650 [Patulibacter sp. NPDC049589]|uniref:hypothetical protein n=1 Tax=Patulibacter sp. NPDC049589 TaxID=3154731 RepID=UPI00342B2FB9
MADREFQEIGRRISDTLEEIRILRVEHARVWQETSDRWAAQHEATVARWEADREQRQAQWAAYREHQDEMTEEMRALRGTSDLQTAELREVSRTNAIQTDALRLLIDRASGD